MKIVITKEQYRNLVVSLLDTLIGEMTIRTVKEKREDSNKEDYHSVFNEDGDLVITIWVKGNLRSKGCEKDLTLENKLIEKFEKYMPYYKHKIFSEVLVDYIYDKFGIKCDCIQYDHSFKEEKHVDDDGDEYEFHTSKTRRYNIKKKKKIKESTNDMSNLENLIYSFLKDDFYPDYDWGPELFDFYDEEVRVFGLTTFHIDDSEAYTYYDDGTLEIMPWVCEKLNEYFNDSWYSVFKYWFEENSGLKVERIVDSTNNNVLLHESIDKNKKFLKDSFGVDFSDRIQQITSTYDVPMSFDDGIGSDMIKRYLNFWGPMYLFELDGVKYLYQDRGAFEWFIDEEGFEMVDNEIIEKLGIGIMGLTFSDIIDMYFQEEE